MGSAEERRAAMKAARERRRVRLVESHAIAEGVRALQFEVVSGSPVIFTPGQYINLHLPGEDGMLSRSYSLSHVQGLRVAVTEVEGGAASRRLHRMKIGEELEVDGPWGLFTLGRAPDDAPLLFVGTGTGFVPLRGMLEAELASGRKRPLRVLFGTRGQVHRLWPDELVRWAAESPRLRVVTTLSRALEGWDGPTGYVQDQLPAVLEGLPTAHVFICGLRAMIDAVRTRLKEQHGFDRKRIHTERYD